MKNNNSNTATISTDGGVTNFDHYVTSTLLQVTPRNSFEIGHLESLQTSIDEPELRDETPMDTFELSENFGYRYFEDEEETSKEHLENMRNLYVWFFSLTANSQDQVKKQWREMAVQIDFEKFAARFWTELYPSIEEQIEFNKAVEEANKNG